MGTPGRPIDNYTKERIIQMKEQGVSSRDIADAQRLTKGTVNRILRNSVDKNSVHTSNRD